MNISERYRELTADVDALARAVPPAGGEKPLQLINSAAMEMGELREQVGDIPRIRLEARLTPALLKSHNQLDRARLLLEEGGEPDSAARIWSVQQKIYRLLNDL